MTNSRIDLNALATQLRFDEGVRSKPYKDSVGKLTVGVGHNLDDKPLSDRAIGVILDDDITDVLEDLDRVLPWWRTMSEPRQRVLANMCFNMGISRLLEFKNTLAAMKSGDWEAAASGMEQSKWFTQVGGRAVRLVAVMRQG